MSARKIALAVLLLTPLGAAIASTWLVIDSPRAKFSRHPDSAMPVKKLKLGFNGIRA